MSASQYVCWVKWCGAANQDLDKEWGCVIFSLPNFVFAPFYFKLQVIMLIDPGKLIWHVQAALMKSPVKGYTKMTQAQKTPNVLKFLLWSYLVMQSEIFKSFFWKQNYPKKTNFIHSHSPGFRHHHCPPRLHHRRWPQVPLLPCGWKLGQEGPGRHSGFGQSLFQVGER